MAGNRRQASLDPGGIEGGVVGDGDGRTGDQLAGLVTVDPGASDVGIGDAGQSGDLSRNGVARVFKPLPGLADLHDDAPRIEGDALDRQIDDRVVRIEANRLDIDHRGSADRSLGWGTVIGANGRQGA